MPQTPKPPHLRAVSGLAGPEDVVSTPEADAEALDATPREATPSPIVASARQMSSSLAQAVAEPIAHAGLSIIVGSAGAAVGGLTGRTWWSAGVGAGVNLFLLGMGMAVLNRQLRPTLRWAYLVIALAGGGGAGYSLWAGGKRK